MGEIALLSIVKSNFFQNIQCTNGDFDIACNCPIQRPSVIFGEKPPMKQSLLGKYFLHMGKYFLHKLMMRTKVIKVEFAEQFNLSDVV